MLPFLANAEHLATQKELVISTESNKYSIALAKYLKNKGVVKYSAYWCPNCHDQAQLFGKKAYKGDTPAAMARKGGAKNLEYEVDGLSGATLTCNGVNDMMNFWLGENGYGNYLSNLKGGS